MCGIVGIYRLDGGAVDRSLLAEMTAQLHHRGPDDSDLYLDGPIGLGHTRLSIIDLAGSRQPMSDESGRYTVTFNGEILNYRDLRREIPYPYRTEGDTEALLAVHRAFGPSGIERLRGQFAYALHDNHTRTLHLGRDRLGILPLYYYADRTVFAFASEIKALLPALPAVHVDEESLHDYLAHRSVPAPHTLYAGVRKLAAGHRLEIHASGDLRSHRYWSIPSEPVRGRRAWTPTSAVDAVEAALTSSIGEALTADVPVGAYLSGGVDSSLITALASRQSGSAVETYAAGFGGADDELHWARRVSEHLGTHHHEVHVTPESFAAAWENLSWHRDGPLSEPADVAVFELARRARQDVKVVLSGEGSDELFAGYPKHRFARHTRWAGLIPTGPRRAVLTRLARHLPARASRLDIALRAAMGASYAERMRGWFAPFTETERVALLGRGPERSSMDPYTRASGDALHRMLYADTHTWLSDNLLERGDRMSMAASLELRPPFLDHRVVELAFALPSWVKRRDGRSKWVVKEVARRHLPGDVVDRRKVGFRVPLDDWLRNGLRDFSGELLTSGSSFVGEMFDRTEVARLLDRHHTGTRNEWSRLWTLTSLEVWHRAMTQRMPTPSTARLTRVVSDRPLSYRHSV